MCRKRIGGGEKKGNIVKTLNTYMRRDDGQKYDEYGIIFNFLIGKDII